jgi:tetratricopeptide (TPR) repeat protein
MYRDALQMYRFGERIQMSEENSFGSMLTTARRRMGWNQQELAEKFDTPVSRVTVNRWEKDIQHPSSYHLEKLIAILGLADKEADALNRASGQPTFRIRILPLRNQLFTGREGQLELVGQRLKENSSVALIGLAGIGKTQLALEYAHCSYPDVYRAVFWVDAANSTILLASYDKIARKLGLSEQDERDQELRILAVKSWLEDHTNWLLIMDNADDLKLARSFFPSAHDGHILLTTRMQNVGKVASKIEVEKMEPEEGRLFLLRRSDTSKVKATLNDFAIDTREAAIRAVELLDGHPLALDQAGAYIEGGASLTDYIDHYNEQRRCVLEDRGPLDDDHPESVVVTFDLCFDRARAQHPLAGDILRFCAFLQPEAIPDELFKCDDSFKLDRIALKKGKEALLRYSLMKWNTQEKTFSMHRLVQALLIDDTPPDVQQQWRVRVVRALNAAFPQVKFEEWTQCERLLSHVLACTPWVEKELIPTLEFSGLLFKAGTYLTERGRHSEAEMLLAQALYFDDKHLGAGHLNTAPTLNNLAQLYMSQGKYSDAEVLYLESLRILEEHLGAEHPRVAVGLNNLALLYMSQGELSQAEPLLSRALSIHEIHLRAGHIDIDLTLCADSIAKYYFSQGKYSQAELWYRRELSLLEKLLGADQFYSASPLGGLAAILLIQGRYEQAEAFLYRALVIQERRLGKTDPSVQNLRRNYTNVLHLIGRDDDAEALETNNEPSA